MARLIFHGRSTPSTPSASVKPAVKPPTPAAPVMSAAERVSRERTAALFALWDQMRSLAAQYGEPDHNIAIDFAQRGVAPDAARREFASRAAIRGWTTALSAVHSPMH